LLSQSVIFTNVVQEDRMQMAASLQEAAHKCKINLPHGETPSLPPPSIFSAAAIDVFFQNNPLPGTP
jgi:hypothetical protein